MRITDMDLSPEPEESLVQFVRDVTENADPDDEHDCEIQIETVRMSEVGTLLGDEIPTRGPPIDVHDIGVKFTFLFEENTDSLDTELTSRARSFFDNGEYKILGEFNGAEGVATMYVLLATNEE